MSEHYEYDDDRPLCFRCDGVGEVPCHCGGDLCVCGAEDIDCPSCHGDGRVSKERYEKQVAAHNALMKSIWNDTP